MKNSIAVLSQARARILPGLVLVALFLSSPAALSAAEIPKPGTVLPDIALQAPEDAQDRAALGLGDAKTFTIGQIKAEYLLIEVVGVYCPICHEQAPAFNKLHQSLIRGKLADKIAMVALATDATPKELELLREKFRSRFPILTDPGFVVHKAIGEPLTPFTFLVDKQRTTLLTHMGRIEDLDALYQQVKALAK